MPIKFISLNEEFIKNIKKYNYEGYVMKIEEYKPTKKTYYVSPANSLCFMDGGIDYSLSRIIFPNIERSIKKRVQIYGKTTLLGRKYLPIGSSLIMNYNNIKSLIVAPTMLLPQNVSNTNNAYYSTISILNNILVNKGENINDIDILFTSMCCGYGKMNINDSINQIINGIKDYKKYKLDVIDEDLILFEPNLHEQPNYYQNTEWKEIDIKDIVTC